MEVKLSVGTVVLKDFVSHKVDTLYQRKLLAGVSYKEMEDFPVENLLNSSEVLVENLILTVNGLKPELDFVEDLPRQDYKLLVDAANEIYNGEKEEKKS